MSTITKHFFMIIPPLPYSVHCNLGIKNYCISCLISTSFKSNRGLLPAFCKSPQFKSFITKTFTAVPLSLNTMTQSFESDVSAGIPFTLKRVNILESYMTYINTRALRADSQEVALFIHGNPVSSYLWRNIIPHISPKVRCVAPELIG